MSCVPYCLELDNMEKFREFTDSKEGTSPLVGLIEYLCQLLYDELVCLITSRFQMEVRIGNISGFSWIF